MSFDSVVPFWIKYQTDAHRHTQAHTHTTTHTHTHTQQKSSDDTQFLYTPSLEDLLCAARRCREHAARTRVKASRISTGQSWQVSLGGRACSFYSTQCIRTAAEANPHWRSGLKEALRAHTGGRGNRGVVRAVLEAIEALDAEPRPRRGIAEPASSGSLAPLHARRYTHMMLLAFFEWFLRVGLGGEKVRQWHAELLRTFWKRKAGVGGAAAVHGVCHAGHHQHLDLGTLGPPSWSGVSRGSSSRTRLR